MSVFSSKSFDEHEQVVFFNNKRTGLKAIIAVHNTNLGPALGGCRMWDYASDEDALTDVLRLSKGMTYKAALAGLELGGGKSVIIGNSKTQKTPEMLQFMGKCVSRMKDRYIIAEDVGTSVADMVEIAKHTDHVVGLPGTSEGGASGDPSPVTAEGVFIGMKAAVQNRLGKDIRGVHVAVQGLGHVGMYLCEFLHNAGAVLTVTDINKDAIAEAQKRFGATVVDPSAIYDVAADVYSPCALGATLNDDTLSRLKTTVVAGAANNQLLEVGKHGDALKQKNILYTPDYVLNAGGLINVYYEWKNIREKTNKYKTADVKKHLNLIDENLKKIFALSEQNGTSTAVAADRLAEQIFATPKKSLNEVA